MALNDLCLYMSRYYNKKVVVLMDEYDTPMQEAYINGYWNEFTAFIRSLFNAAFKTNVSLERAVMKGITRVSKESIFSDVKNGLINKLIRTGTPEIKEMMERLMNGENIVVNFDEQIVFDQLGQNEAFIWSRRMNACISRRVNISTEPEAVRSADDNQGQREKTS